MMNILRHPHCKTAHYCGNEVCFNKFKGYKQLQKGKVRVVHVQAQTQDAKSTKSVVDSLKKGGPGTSYGQDSIIKVPVERIRNFSIIAHIDHGKSTLADQLLLKTKSLSANKVQLQAQYLDGMDLERERGITIKLNTARMKYTAKDGNLYALNLIDTPGHVDFGYEVSRSLAACEAAILVVDASQGVEAQTIANAYLAVENDLEIIVVLNKIDLPAADVERTVEEIEQVLGIDCSKCVHASAKSGLGIDEVLEAIIEQCPPPKDRSTEPLKALIFDSAYDNYRGVVCQFRVVSGVLRKGDQIRFMQSGREATVDWLAAKAPEFVDVDCLYAGEVGLMSGSIKAVEEARVGDTITLADETKAADQALPGYKEATPMVFCGMYPTDQSNFNTMKDALQKLTLNDAALQFEPEASSALGFGFRVGFLGMLHMDVVQERLEREYNLKLIITAPSVVYRVHLNGQKKPIDVTGAGQLPELTTIRAIEEPFCRVEIIVPEEYSGTVIEMCQKRRGDYKELTYLSQGRTNIIFDMPLAEVITSFFDELKSKTRGYASMDYALGEYREEPLIKLNIKINGETAEPLAVIVHQSQAQTTGRNLVEKLKELIPRQQFPVPIQACKGEKPIASTKIPAMRKDVTAKCYGGDIQRKKKLLARQAEGKKRLKQLGRVNVPQEAFLAIVQVNKNDD